MNRNTISIVVAALLFGSIGIVSKFIDLPVVAQNFYRFLFAAVFFLLFLLYKKEKISFNWRKDWPWMVPLGIAYASSGTTFTEAVRYISISNSAFIFYTYPVIVTLLSPIILREKISKSGYIALTLALIGLYFLIEPSSLSESNLHGILFAFIAALSYAIVILTSRNLLKTSSPYVLVFLQSVFSCIVLIPLFIYGGSLAINFHEFLLLAFFGLISSGLGILLLYQGMKNTSAQKASIILYLEPISATVYALVLFSQAISFSVVLGGILILFAAYLVTYNARDKKSAS